MVRLEELPSEALTETSDATNNVPAQLDGGPDMDDLYEQAAARGGFTDRTFEEALSELSKTPLFMTSLADAGTEENVALEALQALQYEGPKSEAAQNFKEQGNESVQEKKWSDAKEYYTKGIAVLQDKDETRWDQPEDSTKEQDLRLLLNEQLHINRARCNLELSESTILEDGSATDQGRELPFHDTGLRYCAKFKSI